MSNFSDAERITLLLRRNGFTFEANGDLNKPKDCNQFHQNLLLTLFINGGLNLVNGRYQIPKIVAPAMHQRILAAAGPHP